MPNAGPLGQERGVGFGIFIYIITFGIYGLYWTFMTFDELKRHTKQGVGGGIGLLLGFVSGGITTLFIAPSEVGKMYAGDGREAPVRGLTGFWVLLPLIGGFIWFAKVQGSMNTYWQLKKSESTAVPAPASA